MARPKKTLDEMEDMEEANASPESEIETINDEINALIHDEQLGIAEAHLWVKDKSGRFVYLTTIPIENFSIDSIAQTYGGGQYRAYWRDSKHKQTGKQSSFQIDSRIVGEISKSPNTTERSNEAVTVQMLQMIKELKAPAFPTNSNDQTTLLMAMMRQQSESQQMLMQMQLEATKSQQGNMVALVTALAPVLSSFLTTKNVTPTSSDGEIIKLLLSKQLEGKDTLGELEKLISLQRKLENGGQDEEEDEEDSPFKQLMNGASMALPSIIQAVTGKAMQQPTPQQLPQPTQSPQLDVEEIEEEYEQEPIQITPQMELNIAARIFFNSLLRAAKSGKQNQASFAEQALNMLNDEQKLTMYNNLQKDNWFDMFSNEPEAIPHKEWFAVLREKFISGFDASRNPG
jgi:hypothetical protein